MNLDNVLIRDGAEFVEYAYAMILGRTPEPAAVKAYVMDMAAGKTKTEILLELCGSEEAVGRKTYSRDLLISQLREAGVKEAFTVDSFTARIRKFGRKVSRRLKMKAFREKYSYLAEGELARYEAAKNAVCEKNAGSGPVCNVSQDMGALLPYDTYRIYRGFKEGVIL